jgi:hypothetical protein
MLVPIYLGLCRQANLDTGHEAAGTLMNANLGMAVLVAIVHATAMIAAGGCSSWLAEIRIAELVQSRYILGCQPHSRWHHCAGAQSLALRSTERTRYWPR